MKKTLKSILVVALMAMVLVTLAGCGKKEEKKENSTNEDKLVATKVEDGMNQKIEIIFKDNKADKVVMTMELDSEDTAKALADLSKSSEETQGMEVKAEGKNLVMTMNASAFADEAGLEDDEASMLTKDVMKKALEEEGYTIAQ